MLKYNFSILFTIISLFLQAQTPDAPILDSVSTEPVNVKGDVYIGWQPVTSTGVKGYIIYRDLKTSIETPNWETLDTVWGATSTSYIDISSNADGEYEYYIMRSFTDTDKSLFSNSFSTIYTFPYIETENCRNVVRVHWDFNEQSNVTFDHFDIYCSADYGPYSKINTVTNVERNFIHSNIIDQTSYSYFIRGIFSDGRTVTSNSVRTFTNLPSTTKFLNADFATAENNAIKLQFTLDETVDVRNYQIVRSTLKDGIYAKIYRIDNYHSLKLNYTDYNIDASQKYFYKVQAIDLCGNAYIESNIAQNIILDVKNIAVLPPYSRNYSYKQLITWDYYDTWLGGDLLYKLYRIIGDRTELIYSTYNGINFFTDEMYKNDLKGVTSKLCYEIVATEGDSNPYGVKGSSKSHKFCVKGNASLHMPNAFTPNGDRLNDVYKPSTIFVSYKNYIFQIYDRWGQIIFETSDITKGWNGTAEHGLQVLQGTFYYYVQYFDFNNNKFEKAGNFTLFRR